eukprot:CAMPEP_0118869384 /NCGR_PEP_ID=MMETSP1163-20130328/12742_1 /TAXON_ID=124430 /ORGANISM="Phaeomonas parva, Strain CCMP2877" /LENGTH=236 /DNA_ID=CAMNT_0006804273 /DNA_START=272 /DNA_END=978 /DNA_ORIENTATION=+
MESFFDTSTFGLMGRAAGGRGSGFAAAAASEASGASRPSLAMIIAHSSSLRLTLKRLAMTRSLLERKRRCPGFCATSLSTTSTVGESARSGSWGFGVIARSASPLDSASPPSALARRFFGITNLEALEKVLRKRSEGLSSAPSFGDAPAPVPEPEPELVPVMYDATCMLDFITDVPMAMGFGRVMLMVGMVGIMYREPRSSSASAISPVRPPDTMKTTLPATRVSFSCPIISSTSL